MKPQRRTPASGSIDGFLPSSKHRKLSPAPPFTSQARPKPELRQPKPPIRANSSQQTAFPRYFAAPVISQTSAANSAIRKAAPPQKHWKSRAKRGTLVALALLLVTGGWLGSRILGNIDKVFHGNVFSDAHALLSHTKLKGEDQGRVNILLAGNSVDDPNHGGANLTDSIMVISVDTVHHTGFMLSIPRDTWVDIPGQGHQKINAANTVTNFKESGYPNGGMGQLEQIISTNFGIPIDYYSLIDYTALRDAVNSVGGITVNVQSGDPRGLYDPNIARADGGPLKLPNGPVTLDGRTALNLARARGDAYNSYGFPQSDFDRTQHQRLMLTALEQKAASAGVLANPIKVGQLFGALGSNVKTDLNLQGVLRFIQITKGMNVQGLQSLALSYGGTKPLLKSYSAPDGESALIPAAGIDDYSQIQQYYNQLTSNNPFVKENPSVVILNASNATGLAHREATLLQQKGFTIAGTADANGVYPSSLIIDTTKGQKPNSAKSLQQLFSGATTTTVASGSAEATEAQGYNADFVVVLGQNAGSSTVTQQP